MNNSKLLITKAEWSFKELLIEIKHGGWIEKQHITEDIQQMSLLSFNQIQPIYLLKNQFAAA